MIKRIYPLLGGLFLSATALAQSSNDALLYSPNQPFGTARTQALGGAGVGLGGDYSSTHINPAGIGIFKTGEFLISAGLGLTNNTSDYLGNKQLDNKGNKTNFQVPSIGVIYAFNKYGGSWKNVTLSIGYTRLANYNNKFAIAGYNDKSSLTDQWVDNLVGASDQQSKSNYPLDASLAYNSHMIVPWKNPTTNQTELLSYASPTRQDGGPIALQQRGIMETSGGLNELTVAVAGNYDDKLYIGASVNVPNVVYKENFTWSEDDAGTNHNNNFGYFDYNRAMKRTGLGISGKFGILYKVTDRFRLGATVYTPTAYFLHDSYTADLKNDLEGLGAYQIYSTDVTNGYDVSFDYTYVAPFRAAGGASYFFGDITDPKKVQGFITADYEYVNQGSGKFKISDDRGFQKTLNDNISAIYTSTSTVRVGAEVKFATFYAIRGGFASYGNPYSNDSYNNGLDGSRKVYSGGLGFRNKGVYLDLTYSYTQGNDRFTPYTVYEPSLTPKAAKLDYTRSNIVMTLGFKF
ncbi:MAG TPA: hypothetical protein VM802_27115 [Chitinophaga sp.]|uniref:OmpP1/FadL family transporter n=1 Tax=Chitinophaga sp. TaxID=1869181 RepID=UPI002BD57ADE|nr:hypothetical protein [Chitinophaga sp.]HVI48569.1 hypothetical protein [Chitinophaga sp.]